MSRERELLERAYQYIPMSSVTSQEIRAYLAESKQDEDPVAWTNQDELNDLGPYINCYMYLVPEAGYIPLYLHPAPRPEFVRLSEEEIMDLWFECAKRRPPESVIVFARAIEDALEEKNK